MGFPMGCSELLFPRLLLYTAFLLDSVRRLIHWLLASLGLAHLLLDPSSEPDVAFSHSHAHGHAIHESHVSHPEFRSVSAMLIQELLPVARFDEIACGAHWTTEGCAVCLCEFEGADEVRRLGNCRHVFHRACLDRWVEHDQRTCPLCRTPLVPDELRDAFNDRLWAAAGVPDSYYSSEYSPSSLHSSPVSPS